MVVERPASSHLPPVFPDPDPCALTASDGNARLLTWTHLELKRLQKLGMPYRYSRHCVVRREGTVSPGSVSPRLTDARQQVVLGPVALQAAQQQHQRVRQSANPGLGPRSNSLAPFYTMAKPTCGYHFSWDTDNRKRRTGLNPSNLVQWRTAIAAGASH